MNRYIKERGLLARIGSICILTIACMTFTYADQHKNKTEQFMEGILSFRFSSSNINFKPTFIYDELPDKLKNIIMGNASCGMEGDGCLSVYLIDEHIIFTPGEKQDLK